MSSSVFPLSRAQAFCLHLTLSLLAFSTLVFAMLALWFPGELFLLDGGWQGLKLVAMVDLVLGPALTLLLYKPGKPKLKLDLTLIASIQIAALGYGFVATYQQRTVAVVFAEGRLTTLSGAALADANEQLLELDEEPQSIQTIADGRTPVVVNPTPDRGEFGSHLAELLNGYPEPHERSDRFVSAAEADEDLAEAALTLAELDAPVRDRIETALDERRLAPELVQLHRFRARYGRGIAIYDPTRHEVLEWVSAPPTLAAALPDEN